MGAWGVAWDENDHVSDMTLRISKSFKDDALSHGMDVISNVCEDSIDSYRAAMMIYMNISTSLSVIPFMGDDEGAVFTEASNVIHKFLDETLQGVSDGSATSSWVNFADYRGAVLSELRIFNEWRRSI